MNCPEIQEMLSAYYDSELPQEKCDQIDAHLQECSRCAAEIKGFGKLSSLEAHVATPETPGWVWSEVERELGNEKRQQKQIITSGHSAPSRKMFFRYTAALAVTTLIGFAGFQLFYHGDDDHQEMAEAMEYVVANVDTDGVATHLLNKYGGAQVSPEEAFSQVSFYPVASMGLPAGYAVESIQVLNMPCCKCTQTACRRPDNSRFFIFEHDNKEPGWFEHRNRRLCNCGGKECQVVELDSRLAATYEKGNRHITMLGVRDEDEIELLVSQFEEN